MTCRPFKLPIPLDKIDYCSFGKTGYFARSPSFAFPKIVDPMARSVFRVGLKLDSTPTPQLCA